MSKTKVSPVSDELLSYKKTRFERLRFSFGISISGDDNKKKQQVKNWINFDSDVSDVVFALSEISPNNNINFARQVIDEWLDNNLDDIFYTQNKNDKINKLKKLFEKFSEAGNGKANPKLFIGQEIRNKILKKILENLKEVKSSASKDEKSQASVIFDEDIKLELDQENEKSVLSRSYSKSKLQDLQFVFDNSGDNLSYLVNDWLDPLANQSTKNIVEVFEIIGNASIKSDIANEWFNNKRLGKKFSEDDNKKTTAQDLTNLLPFIAENEVKEEIAESWLGYSKSAIDGNLLKTKSTQDILTILPLIAKSQKYEIIKSWIAVADVGNVTGNDLEKILNSLESDHQRSEFFNLISDIWLTDSLLEYRSAKYIKLVLSFIKNYSSSLDYSYNQTLENSNQSAIVEKWFNCSLSNRTLDDLKFISPFITPTQKEKIAQDWFKSSLENRTKSDLESVFQFIDNEQDKQNIAKTWLNLTLKDRTAQDLESVFQFIDSEDKSDVARTWFDLPVNNSLENVAILRFYNDVSQKEKTILKLAKSSSLNTKNDLTRFFENVNQVIEIDTKFRIAKKWFNEKSQKNRDDLKFLLDLSVSASDKSSLVQEWFGLKLDLYNYKIDKALLKNRSAKDLDFLQFVELSRDKNYIAKTWLDLADNITMQDLKDVLEYVVDDETFSKKSKVISWFSKSLETRTLEDLKSCLDFNDDDDKPRVAEEWFNKSPQTKTLQDLKFVLSINNTSSYRQLQIAESWIKNNKESFYKIKKSDIDDLLKELGNEFNKSRVVNLWFGYDQTLKDQKILESRKTEDFKGLLPYITDKDDIIESWLSLIDVNAQDLNDILHHVKKGSVFRNKQSELAQKWFNKSPETKDLKDLRTALSFIDDVYDKNGYAPDNMAINWFNLPKNRNLENFKGVLGLIKKDYNIEAIAVNWIEKSPQITKDELAEINRVNNKFILKNIVQGWFGYDSYGNINQELFQKRDLQDLNFVLSHITDNKIKSKIAKDWIEKSPKVTRDDLAEILKNLDDQDALEEIVQGWFGYDRYKNINQELFLKRDLEDLNFSLPYIKGHNNRSELTQAWIKKSPQITKDDIAKILTNFSQDTQHKYDLSEIVQSWFGYSWDNNKIDQEFLQKRTLEDLNFALPYIEDHNKSGMVLSWFGYSWDNNKINQEFLQKRTLEDLNFILPYIVFNQIGVVLAWLEESPQIKKEELTQILGHFSFDQDKCSIFRIWIEKSSQVKKEDLEEILSQFFADSYKSEIITSWLKSHKEMTKEGLHELLKGLNDGNQKMGIIDIWMKNQQPEKKQEDFVYFAKEGLFLSPYNVNEIAKKYIKYKLPKKDFVELGEVLYGNNENLRTELFKAFVHRFYSNFLQPNKQILTDFISSLNNDHEALEALNVVRNKNILSKREILNAANNRVTRKYESLTKVLMNKNLSDSLTDEGFKAISQELGEESIDDIKLNALFSYYDLLGEDPIIFKSLLKAEALEEIRKNFIPAEDKPYIKEVELVKIQALFNDPESSEFNTVSPKVAVLSSYLSNKVKEDVRKTITLTEEEISSYEFGNSPLFPKESEEGKTLLERFKNLLREDLQKLGDNVANVTKVFEELLRLDKPIDNIIPKYAGLTEAGNLFEFFSKNKFLVAFVFAQENGLDDFISAITTLQDGCFANIGTNAKAIASKQLFQDSCCDQILYGVFYDKIYVPNTNSVEHHKSNSGAAAIFSEDNINKHFISPLGFLRELFERFESNKSNDQSAVSVIREIIGDKLAIELLQTFSGGEEDMSRNSIAKTEAKIASYLILKEKLPEVFSSRYLDGFKKECEHIIQARMKIIDANTAHEAAEELIDDIIESIVKSRVNGFEVSKLKDFGKEKKSDEKGIV